MYNLDRIPREFQVFSTQPEIRIRYRISLGIKILFFLVLLPFFVLFTGHCFLLFLGLHAILNGRFWEGIQIFVYNSNNPWFILVFIFSLLLLSLASFFWLYLLLGITELYATDRSLTITYKMLGMFYKKSLLTSDIGYFNQFLNKTGEADSWDLEAISKRRISDKNISFPAWVPAKWISADMVTRMNYKTMRLYSHANPYPTEWLGRVLANFYRVEFRLTAPANSSLDR
jgi:hypothetical protein